MKARNIKISQMAPITRSQGLRAEGIRKKAATKAAPAKFSQELKGG